MFIVHNLCFYILKVSREGRHTEAFDIVLQAF